MLIISSYQCIVSEYTKYMHSKTHSQVNPFSKKTTIWYIYLTSNPYDIRRYMAQIPLANKIHGQDRE